MLLFWTTSSKSHRNPIDRQCARTQTCKIFVRICDCSAARHRVTVSRRNMGGLLPAGGLLVLCLAAIKDHGMPEAAAAAETEAAAPGGKLHEAARTNDLSEAKARRCEQLLALLSDAVSLAGLQRLLAVHADVDEKDADGYSRVSLRCT